MSSSTRRDGDGPSASCGSRTKIAIDDDVVEHGCERGRREPAARVEHRGRERGEAVEEHLRHEQPQQRGRELLLLRASAGSVTRSV